MNRIRIIWSRITLEAYRQPGDTEKMPWYAIPGCIAVVFGAYVVMELGRVTGF